MYLDLCLLSCDLNPTYYEFFPLIKKYWKKKVGIDCILILVANEVPYALRNEKDSIIVFPPLPDIPTAFQAQCIRLLYPCLLEDFNGIIISDMDIIPLHNDFFNGTIKDLNQNQFCIYRDVISKYKQYPMCYCAAASKTWKNIFKINIMNDLRITLTEWYSKNDYCISSPYSEMWAQDQVKLYQYIESYEKQDEIIKFTDKQTQFLRLDRNDIDYITENIPGVKLLIDENMYSDFHLPRPYKKYSDLLEKILD